MTLSPDVVGTMIAAAWFLATRLGRIERKIDEAVVRLNTHEEAIGVLKRRRQQRLPEPGDDGDGEE